MKLNPVVCLLNKKMTSANLTMLFSFKHFVGKVPNHLSINNPNNVMCMCEDTIKKFFVVFFWAPYIYNE